MPRKALDKVPYTPELREKQINLRKFLRSVPEIKWKELKPHGFEINVATIPNDKTTEFLEIVNNVK